MAKHANTADYDWLTDEPGFRTLNTLVIQEGAIFAA